MSNTLLNRHVTSFLQCARDGSFSKAAKSLFISPNALLDQMDLFEQRLGFKLFERSKKGLRLTEQGKILFNDCLELEKFSQGIIERCRNISKAESIVRVGTSSVLSGQLAVTLWEKYQSDFCQLQLHLIPFQNEPQEAVRILTHLGEDIDIICALYDDNFLKRYNCKALWLQKVTLDVAVPINHHLATKESLSLNDLSGQDIFLPKRGICDLYDRAWETLACYIGESHLHNGGFRSLQTYNQAYENGSLAVALQQWGNPHPLFTLKKIDWDLQGNFGLLYPFHPNKATRLFISVLRARLDSYVHEG